MPGLLPKRRTRQEIARAEVTLLQRHDEYFQAWLRNAEAKLKPGTHAETPRSPRRKAKTKR